MQNFSTSKNRWGKILHIRSLFSWCLRMLRTDNFQNIYLEKFNVKSYSRFSFYSWRWKKYLTNEGTFGLGKKWLKSSFNFNIGYMNTNVKFFQNLTENWPTSTNVLPDKRMKLCKFLIEVEYSTKNWLKYNRIVTK